MEPPPCIQNAMLTKDKKPFTYTPGGLNLNEIKSPRMARRIERNAAYEGVGPSPAQQNRPQVPPAALPPSAVAAMQPQMHVQVFPSGPPPPPPMNMSRGGVPPPPPPMTNIPPPPPPPTQPLPTQKFRTADQQVVERPDMTKIIPENPMGLLKKTGGPRVRNTLLEEMYRNPERPGAQEVPVNKNVYQQVPQPPQPQQVRSPPVENIVAYQVQRTPEPRQQAWSPPNQQQEKNVNVGCIYIPPMNLQQNKNVTSPAPPATSPKIQTPGTPTLKEAPKPWQQKQHVKQEEPPQWAKREPSFTPSPVPPEQVTPQSSSIQQQQRPIWPQPSPNPQQQRYPEAKPQRQASHTPEPRYQDPRTQPQQKQSVPYEPRGVYTERVVQPQFDPSSHPNAVFVTQPIVLQHPGANFGPPVINRRENVPLQQEGGVRTIPIQIEGRETPNQNRNLNRQQSWSNNPTQSGSFRVIQKITGTDGEEEDTGVTEHMPSYPQQFPSEQMRKMQLNDTDQELLNRFKQVPNDDGLNKPHIRNIPIQIEGNSAPKGSKYVPPSQQTPAEEPKKYTGGSIPSRSFRMLQAMTAPDSCANVKEANDSNENYDFPYQGNNWAYPPAYPMYNPHPYWPPYYPPNPYKLPSTEHSNSDPELNRSAANKTPNPYFGYPPYTPTRELEQKSIPRPPSSFSRCSSSTELENINWRQTPIPYPMYPSAGTPVPRGKTPKIEGTDSDRDSKTPVPFWYGYPPSDGEETCENTPQRSYNYYPPYPPPFYDPYYHPYFYYGYPPMFSPLPYMIPTNDHEDQNGYSSMDEMAFYNQTRAPNTKNQPAQNLSPEIVVTPTPDQNAEQQKELSSSDSDTETETNDVTQEQAPSSGKLQTIPSVPDINVYKQPDDESEPSDGEEDSDSSSGSSVYEEEREEEEVVPHQLSIIFEVSEVTDTPRHTRESSIYSDCTTVEGMKSDDEEVEDIASKQWISDNLAEIASRIQSRIDARIELDDSEVYTSFTIKTPSPKRDIHSSKDEINGEMSGHEEQSNIKTSNEVYEESKEELQQEEISEDTKTEDFCSTNHEEVKETENLNEAVENKCTETEEVPSKESSDSEDWWGVIGKNEDDFPRRKSSTFYRDSNAIKDNNEGDEIEKNVEPSSEIEETNDESEERRKEEEDEEISENLLHPDATKNETEEMKEKPLQQMESVEDEVFYEEECKETTVPKLEITSAHSSRSSESSRKISSDSEESSDSEDSDSSEDENKNDVNNNEQNAEEETIVIPSIKDRIKALQECISVKKKPTRVEEEIKISVKSHVESIDNGEQNKSKPVSAKSSVKSFDEISEEDSGVTDLSKQYSDNEEFPELRKMSRYQRASTHSRLFQLLQEECENEEEEDEVAETRKSQLSLPLTSNVNDKLAEELVNSMLKQKKGQIFRNMSVEKLHAAAKKVLQEDGDSCDTPSEGFSDFLSPLRNDTGNSTPQEFYGHYNEYMQYYDSWAQAAALQEHEIIQSKTFKMLQDGGQRPIFPTTQPKCPRVVSGKNVHSDLKKLVECPEEASSLNNPDPKS